MAAQSIARVFEDYFRVVPASTPELLDEAYRIRYRVYVDEFGWEPRERFPDGREYDACDRHARHCLLLHRPSGRFAGCVRLVLQNPEDPQAPLPFERHAGAALDPAVFDPARLPRHRFGEVSRLAVPAEFRRRRGERHNPVALIAGAHPHEGVAEHRHRFPFIPVGLYLAAATIGLEEGLDCVFAMMEPRLMRHLKVFGITFRQVSEPVEFRGVRAVFQITRDDLFRHLRPELHALLALIRGQILETPAARRFASPAAYERDHPRHLEAGSRHW
ncbi:PEP-CTERM/exosortase system-associated acyltransferase [Inmirania thermothiophila]|uniref:N-acyl amino acid synthase of PEP-CTERM/exosortase system n=1 Tax=Inmirania thermothiophila TaxID=1750597 RepID=A0A3N1Y881_9GAMM|nr:PEP-CTERM/exosortase system-associated acyltransferase [Inmirania thermothiophila]ROR34731.1 N-acyl amino acid synthase of PEP-CTERM/exosortase system [Inmirania thermothiophila]